MKLTHKVVIENHGEVEVTGWMYGNVSDGIKFELEDVLDEYETPIMFDLLGDDIERIEALVEYDLEAMFN